MCVWVGGGGGGGAEVATRRKGWQQEQLNFPNFDLFILSFCHNND